jgi:hypothetical protein
MAVSSSTKRDGVYPVHGPRSSPSSALKKNLLESIDYEAARASITSLIARPSTSADPAAPQPATARSLRVLDALYRNADIATPTGDEVDDATLTDFVERILASS